MELFTLDAKLSLDKSAFDTGVTEAITQAGSIDTAIQGIDTTTLDNEIAQLDAEIYELDKEFESLEDDIATMDAKTQEMGNGIRTVVEIAKEVAIEAFKAVVSFVSDSLEYLEDGSTEAAKKLQDATYVLENASAMSTDSWLVRLGAFVKTSWADILQSVLGITAEDILNKKLADLSDYVADNFAKVKEELKGVFTEFEKWDSSETKEAFNLTDITGNLQSQIDYWKEYDRVVRSLKERGVDSDIIAQYADGKEESLRMLQSLESASDEELDAYQRANRELNAERTKTADTLSAAQLEVDEQVAAMEAKIEELGMEAAYEDESGGLAYKKAQEIISELAAQYPNISAYVDSINAKLETLGQVTFQTVGGTYTVNMSEGTHVASFTGDDIHQENSGPNYEDNLKPISYYRSPANQESINVVTGQWDKVEGRATGMDYVPYNDYPARLHEGEAVLTKAQASEWRRKDDSTGVSIDYAALGSAVAAAMTGMSVSMDKVTVGHMVSDTVSKDIAQNTKTRRYSA